MYLIIDNYDSFTYNLVSYFEELGQAVQVCKNDAITTQQIKEIKPKGILISPGPKNPENAGISPEVIRTFGGHIPILGVCLGHQTIGYVFGAKIKKGERPMHGKVTKITHNGKNLFQNLPTSYSVTRYHSLIIDTKTLPATLQIDAWDEKNVIMAISHKEMPIYGVQFHPEAVLSEHGYHLIQNFIQICEKWWEKQ